MRLICTFWLCIEWIWQECFQSKKADRSKRWRVSYISNCQYQITVWWYYRWNSDIHRRQWFRISTISLNILNPASRTIRRYNRNWKSNNNNTTNIHFWFLYNNKSIICYIIIFLRCSCYLNIFKSIWKKHWYCYWILYTSKRISIIIIYIYTKWWSRFSWRWISNNIC